MLLTRPVLAVAVTSLLAISACGGQDRATETLSFYSDEFHYAVIPEEDASKGKGSVAGDAFAFWLPLWTDESKEEQAGRIDGDGAVTEVTDKEIHQFATRQFTLEDGTITSAGTFSLDPETGEPIADSYEWSIVGGTGRYEGATGVSTQSVIDDDADEYVLELALPKE